LLLPQPWPYSDPGFAQMLEQTKNRTRQYARSQLRWIKHNLLPAAREAQALGGEVEIFVIPSGLEGIPEAKKIFRSEIPEIRRASLS